MVTEVKERTCNCLLTNSLREIVPGDRAEMRVGNKPTASAKRHESLNPP